MGDHFENRFRYHTAYRVLAVKVELEKIATHNLQDLESIVGVMPMDVVQRVRHYACGLLNELAEAQLQLKVLEYEAGKVSG